MSKETDIIYFLEQGELNNVQIGKRVGCSKVYVGRIKKQWEQSKQPVVIVEESSDEPVTISKREALDKFLDGDTKPLDELIESLHLKDAASVYKMLEGARRERRQSEKLEQDETKLELSVFAEYTGYMISALHEHFRLGEDEELSNMGRRWVLQCVEYLRVNYPEVVDRLRKAGYEW